MNDRKKIEQPVAEEFKRFNDEFADSLRSETHRLQSAIDQLLHASGKHVRPLLVLLTAKACGKVTDHTINSAVFDNRISVLVGDYVLSTALIRSIQTGNLQIINIVSNLGRDLSEGEIKQLETAEESILDEACYMQVIKKKTATLLSSCTEIGAISADAPQELVLKCRKFGEYLGYCFQIKDDIFDYFKEMNIGKPTGNDIREGKVTLPLLHALESGRREEVESFLKVINEKDFSSGNIDALIEFAKANGGIEYAEMRMKEYHDKAVEVLMQLPESDAREGLLALADYIMERQK